MRVVVVKQLSDNFAYLIIDEATQEAAVVDCAEAPAVIEAVRREGCTLKSILPTHHHFDHVGGNLDLLQHFPGLRVYAYSGQRDRIPGATDEVAEGDSISVGTLHARIVFIPAHTTGHVAYYFEEDKAVFTGDTLFAGGCGRLFEGNPAMMLQSLSKLMALPDDTQVYFGHEYTEKNLRFALTLEPSNRRLQDKYAWIQQQVGTGNATTPTSIASEKDTNPFFRWVSPELRATIQERFPNETLDDVGIFAKTREMKDNY